MSTAEPLRCPNCGAFSLPALRQTMRVRCEYCNHVIQLRPGPGPVQVEVGVDLSRRIRRFVAIGVIGTFVLIGGIIAIVVFTGVKAASESANRSRHAQDEIQRKAERLQREALDHAGEALERANAARARARGVAAVAGKEAEASDPKIREAKAKAKPKARSGPPLPETPDPAKVRARLGGIDVSHCPGDFRITYTVRVHPDGSTRTTSMGPMRVRNGGSMSCPRKAIEKLRFGKSRSGLTLKHELRGGAFD